jgi:biopolymer transport protein ExbB
MSTLLPPDLTEFLDRGGPALWLIAALSVLTLTLILWKIWGFLRQGAWAGPVPRQALADWAEGRDDAARAALSGRRDMRARLAHHAMAACSDPTLDDAAAREDTARHARADLAEMRSGLRSLELISTTAPLLGLLGTVLGMIEAFQALQDSGARADPAALAGGIWEALLTTAAGMAVAIPAGLALGWFESLTERMQDDLEDLATRIFLRRPPK